MSTTPTSRDARAELQAAVSDKGWLAPFIPFPTDAPTSEAAVLVLFGVLDQIPARTDHTPVARDLDVLLQRRSATLSSHPGQVSFPGGRRDDTDHDVVHTALREAAEETGLDPTGVEVLATLPELPLVVSNFRVTPVLGWWQKPSEVAAVDHAETVDVFRVPVAHLLDPVNRFTTVRRRGDQLFRGPAFDVDGTVVWGFTAMVLDRLFHATGWHVPWDASVERPI